MVKTSNVPQNTEHQLGVDHLPTPAVMWNPLIGHITPEYTNMSMPKGSPCLPTPSEHAITSLLKKSKKSQKRQLGQRQDCFSEGKLFPRGHCADKTYCIPSETVSGQSSKLINRASIFHKVMTFGSTSRKKAQMAGDGCQLQAHRTPMSTHSLSLGHRTYCAVPRGKALRTMMPVEGFLCKL